MKSPSRAGAFDSLAWLAAAISLLVTWYAVVKAGDDRRQISNRIAEWHELQAFAPVINRRRAAMDAVAAKSAGASNLKDVMREKTGIAQPDMALMDTQPVMDGWMLRRYDARLENIPAERLASLLAAWSDNQGAVRVLGLQVSAAGDPAGRLLSASLELVELAR